MMSVRVRGWEIKLIFVEWGRMKAQKCILAGVIAIVLIAAMAPISTQAQDAVDSDDLAKFVAVMQ
ncbi:MAG: hypothetical protein F4X94_02110, partial [Dehalococcoidia bacterium]|nr:hypothetical protein [Dehalococcoidia bacterium]